MDVLTDTLLAALQALLKLVLKPIQDFLDRMYEEESVPET
jgi:hypothetical protein